MTVYLIKHPGDNAVKIGYTDGDPLRRLRELQTGSASLLELIGTIPHASREMEQQLHDRFANLRLRPSGEWFTNDPSIQEVFERYGTHAYRTRVENRLAAVSMLLAGVYPENKDLPTDELVAAIDSIRHCLEAPICKCVAASPVDVMPESFPDIDYAESIIKLSINSSAKRLKTLEDFHHDHSRFEFSTLDVIYRQMCLAISDREDLGSFYRPSDKAWLLYKAAIEVLPPRAEHREMCHGRPLLLQLAAEMVAMSSPADKETL